MHRNRRWCRSGLAADDVHAVPLKQAGQGENVTDVVVHDQNFFADQGVVALTHPLEHTLLVLRQLRGHKMEEQGRFVKEPLRRLDSLEHNTLRQLPQLNLFFVTQIPAGRYDHGEVL